MPTFKLRIHHLDVGQGESTVIICETIQEVQNPTASQSKTRTVTVIDGGRTTRGGGTLLAHLRAMNVTSVDTIIATHFDNDHTQGLIPLLKDVISNSAAVYCEDIPEKNLALEEDLVQAFYRLAGERRRKAEPGYIIRLSVWEKGPYIKLLNLGATGYDRNAKSIASLVIFNKFRYFTAGDLPSECEEWLVSDLLISITGTTHICALKAGHHGAATSTSSKFVNKIKPTSVFISCGKHSYSHPAQVTINTLHEADSVKTMYLTNCCYDRRYINPRFPSSWFDTIKAKVAGTRETLGHIFLTVNEEQAAAHQFEVHFWDGAQNETKAQVVVHQCGNAVAFGERTYPKSDFSINDQAKLLEDDVVSATAFKGWRQYIEELRAIPPFSLKEGTGANAGPKQLSDNFIYKELNQDEMEDLSKEERAAEAMKKANEERRQLKSIFIPECVACKKPIALNEYGPWGPTYNKFKCPTQKELCYVHSKCGKPLCPHCNQKHKWSSL